MGIWILGIEGDMKSAVWRKKGWISVRRVGVERRVSLVEEIEGIGEKDINLSANLRALI
jgi:hypothetical protein